MQDDVTSNPILVSALKHFFRSCRIMECPQSHFEYLQDRVLWNPTFDLAADTWKNWKLQKVKSTFDGWKKQLDSLNELVTEQMERKEYVPTSVTNAIENLSKDIQKVYDAMQFASPRPRRPPAPAPTVDKTKPAPIEPVPTKVPPANGERIPLKLDALSPTEGPEDALSSFFGPRKPRRRRRSTPRRKKSSGRRRRRRRSSSKRRRRRTSKK